MYRNLKKILSLKFQNKSYLIISSQINPELVKDINKQLSKNKNIKIFYLVDTLKMGEALEKFLNPNPSFSGLNTCKVRTSSLIVLAGALTDATSGNTGDSLDGEHAISISSTSDTNM